jgi:hypothetical protein
VVVWGTGKASREFLYVEDAALIPRGPGNFSASRPKSLSTKGCTEPSLGGAGIADCSVRREGNQPT